MSSAVLCFLCSLVHIAAGQYYGTEVGSLSTNAHDVRGTVYIVDESRIFIKDFYYDGTGPDAFFWVGQQGVTGNSPDGQGTLVPDSSGSRLPLYKHVEADVLLTLPPGRTVGDILWLSVWCRMAGADFGHIAVPTDVTVPSAQTVTTTVTSAQVTSGEVTFLDQRRVRVQDFASDGSIADLFFYAGTSNNAPDGRQKMNDETGSSNSLGVYTGKTIDLVLPDGLTAADISWLIVYSEIGSAIKWRVNPPTGAIPPYTETGYYGNYLGMLTPLDKFSVSGRVYAIDSHRLWVRLFNYDGQCDDTHFTIGLKDNAAHGSTPSANGTRIDNGAGSSEPLTSYADADLVLTLPGSASSPVGQLAWFSVWCGSTQEDLGSLVLGAISVPHTADLGTFSQLAHSVRSGSVYAIDKRTIRIEDFHYDGRGPDAFFLVGPNQVSPSGIKIPDENGEHAKPGAYDGQTITLTLPVGLTVDTIDYLSLYCIQYTQNFGEIRLTQSEYTVPPYVMDPIAEPMGNCEAMNENFNVGWEIMGENIVFEFTGALEADNGYMAFGLSGSNTGSAMIRSDPMVVYLNSGTPTVQDYTISAYSLCSGDQGVCPDTAAGGAESLEMLSVTVRSGVTKVRFQRPLDTGDVDVDKTIPTDRDVYVVWGLGNVNTEQQITKHKTRLTGDKTINFGREISYNCQPIRVEDDGPRDVWAVQTISGMNTKEFRAVIGPTGGKRGYEGITGQISWGISWYLNGLLIPELTVRRGETYTFKVHGGSDPSNQAKYHPLYITDDAVGGYADKNPNERRMVTIYAGTSSTFPNGTVGSYCELKTGRDAEDFETFDEFAATLTEDCEGTESPGEFTWTPGPDTPDLVYYQCYTHNFLGWKIHVVDEYSSGVAMISPVAVLVVITSFLAVGL